MKRLLFVLGPPGAGKGTMCEKLSDHYNIGNFSVGNLLREANNPEVEDCMMNARIVPIKITCEILMAAVMESQFDLLHCVALCCIQ